MSERGKLRTQRQVSISTPPYCAVIKILRCDTIISLHREKCRLSKSFFFLIKRVLWSPVSKMFREETVLEFNVHSAYDSPDVYILKKV